MHHDGEMHTTWESPHAPCRFSDNGKGLGDHCDPFHWAATPKLKWALFVYEPTAMQKERDVQEIAEYVVPSYCVGTGRAPPAVDTTGVADPIPAVATVNTKASTIRVTTRPRRRMG